VRGGGKKGEKGGKERRGQRERDGAVLLLSPCRYRSPPRTAWRRRRPLKARGKDKIKKRRWHENGVVVLVKRPRFHAPQQRTAHDELRVEVGFGAAALLVGDANKLGDLVVASLRGGHLGLEKVHKILLGHELVLELKDKRGGEDKRWAALREERNLAGT
jgi:hypothetical protein